MLGFVGLAVIPYAFVALFKKTPLLLRAYIPIYLVIIAQFAFVIYAGGDWMPSFRLLLPTLPLILFVLMDQVDISAFTKEKMVASLAAIIVITSCLWATERDVVKNWQTNVTGLRLEFQTYDANYYDIAQALAKISVPNESVLIAEAGLIPYVNDKLNFDDLYGLMDKHIAKDVKGKHLSRVDNDYFFAHNYDYFVVATSTETSKWIDDTGKYHVGNFAVESFMNDPRFNKTYTPVYRQKIGAIFKRIESVNATVTPNRASSSSTSLDFSCGLARPG